MREPQAVRDVKAAFNIGTLAINTLVPDAAAMQPFRYPDQIAWNDCIAVRGVTSQLLLLAV